MRDKNLIYFKEGFYKAYDFKEKKKRSGATYKYFPDEKPSN